MAFQIDELVKCGAWIFHARMTDGLGVDLEEVDLMPLAADEFVEDLLGQSEVDVGVVLDHAGVVRDDGAADVLEEPGTNVREVRASWRSYLQRRRRARQRLTGAELLCLAQRPFENSNSQ